MQMTNVHLHPPHFYKLFTNVREKNSKISEHFLILGLPLFVGVCYNVRDVLRWEDFPYVTKLF